MEKEAVTLSVSGRNADYTPLEGSSRTSRSKACFAGVGGIVLLALICVATYAGVRSLASAENSAADLGEPFPVMNFDDVDFPEVSSLVDGGCPHEHGRVTLPSGASAGRAFEFFVPSGGVSAASTVVFVWHGITSTPAEIEEKVQLKHVANTRGWALVYPLPANHNSGTLLKPVAWNGAGCCDQNVGDDVQFALDILSYLKTNGCADTNKAFSVGFSNGGFMTYRLACEHPTKFRAFAPHSGLMGDYGGNLANSPWKNCPGNPKLMVFHGESDKVVPFLGGKQPFKSAQWWSAQQVIDIFASRSGCELSGVYEEPTLSPAHTCKEYTGTCSIKFCHAKEVKHDWIVGATASLVDFFVAAGAD